MSAAACSFVSGQTVVQRLVMGGGVGCDGMGGCMLTLAGVGRYLQSTSLSGTLPDTMGGMTGLLEL